MRRQGLSVPSAQPKLLTRAVSRPSDDCGSTAVAPWYGISYRGTIPSRFGSLNRWNPVARAWLDGATGGRAADGGVKPCQNSPMTAMADGADL